MAQVEKTMVDAYLIKVTRIPHPESNSPVVFAMLTKIKVNPYTGIAWIKSFQVELPRHSYSLVN